MADLSKLVCPACEEAPRTFRGDLRVATMALVIEDNNRLRTVLKEIASRCAETEIGLVAERALSDRVSGEMDGGR